MIRLVRASGVLIALCAAGSAFTQILPSKTYNGLGRPLIVNVKPAETEKGPFIIKLLRAGTAEVVEESVTKKGFVDLAKHFPSLMKTTKPECLYAQLYSDTTPIGSALVLQPMLNPQISKLNADGKTVDFVTDEDGPMFNGYRAFTDQHILWHTSLGDIEVKMRPDACPNTSYIIRELVRGGYYTGTIVHRIVAKRKDGTPFVVQGGDPTGTGSGGPGFAYPLEKSKLEHDFGVIGIARSTDPNTNGGQIYFCLSREGTKHLDGRYATIAQTVKGADVILKLAEQPVGDKDRPNKPPVIIDAKLVPAPPYPLELPALKRPEAK